MIDLTTTDLTSLTAVELRKVGAQAGIKGAAKGKKADLLAALAPIQLEQRKAKEEIAKPAELDKRYVRNGRSRAGMVIVAKGTEVHKSNTFKEAAEKAGWKVVVDVLLLEVEEDGETFEVERHMATATKGDKSMVLCWNGRAYDYPNSWAQLDTAKVRKVRNLKEALRLI